MSNVTEEELLAPVVRPRWRRPSAGLQCMGCLTEQLKGFPSLLEVLKRGPLLQKETSIEGGPNYIPPEMGLDSPNNQMRSELLFPLRDGGTEALRF